MGLARRRASSDRILDRPCINRREQGGLGRRTGRDVTALVSQHRVGDDQGTARGPWLLAHAGGEVGGVVVMRTPPRLPGGVGVAAVATGGRPRWSLRPGLPELWGDRVLRHGHGNGGSSGERRASMFGTVEAAVG